MATKVPGKDALDLTTMLAELLKSLPSAHDNRQGHIEVVRVIKHTITSNGGTFTDSCNGARLRAHGFAASSTEGFVAAVRNWIAQVTLKAALASMAGAA